MGRIPRMTLSAAENAVFHVMSRTALPGFPMGDIENEYFLDLLKNLSRFYFVELLGFALMGNHHHLVLRMHPGENYSDEEIYERFKAYYADKRELSPMQIPFYREKLSSLSGFIKELKQGFSRFYNKRHGRKGFFWADRFKSLIVENGETLINLLAYVDLNAVRAGIVDAPENYRWCSIGHHVQTGNKDGLLSTNFGLEGHETMSGKERFKQYRMFLYRIGSKEVSGKGTIDAKTAQKAASNNYELTSAELFKHRSRHFIDSGALGSKEFVSWIFDRFKHYFNSKRDKIPVKMIGTAEIFSLKRLSGS